MNSEEMRLGKAGRQLDLFHINRNNNLMRHWWGSKTKQEQDELINDSITEIYEKTEDLAIDENERVVYNEANGVKQ